MMNTTRRRIDLECLYFIDVIYYIYLFDLIPLVLFNLAEDSCCRILIFVLIIIDVAVVWT